MNTHADKKKEHKHQSAANVITKKQSGNISTFQFVDNRPEAITQRKLRDKITNGTHETQSKIIEEISENITQLKTTNITTSNDVVQLGKGDEDRKRKRKSAKNKTKRKRAKKPGDESDEAWLPSSQQQKHRSTFSKALRRRVITSGALRNKNRMYVCPGCGMPLADRKGREIRTYFISKKKKKRHNIVSGQLDHYPKWSGRLKKLKKKRKNDAQIRTDHDDPSRLRPLCLRCNASHKFEKTKDLPEDGYSDQEYHSDDNERDKEIWKKFRKDDDDNSGSGAGSLMT
ncbi:hypothetical protein IMCC3317_37250 [Kordia antarctica]|uniref:Uncharacterized protein n=1 Tax=Kordia antarctica TaxID=1218801 RepID=A0A7L4ZR33_9FLAO|nr:hypothetical protein [Kordia antarctica]QHI38334.1 hypothetical protein IMCC3317_37250 [Kordia antarctica]